MSTYDSLPMEGDPIDARTTPIESAPLEWKVDDDGIAIDEYFEAMPSSPIPRDLLSSDIVDIPTTTRVITTATTITTRQQALMLPPDPNRIKLYVTAINGIGDPLSTPSYILSSDQMNVDYLSSGVGSAPPVQGIPYDAFPDWSGHTGAVWIANMSDETARFIVMAVTK